mgnify:CR=1 FL=1
MKLNPSLLSIILLEFSPEIVQSLYVNFSVIVATASVFTTLYGSKPMGVSAVFHVSLYDKNVGVRCGSLISDKKSKDMRARQAGNAAAYF